MIHAFGCSLTYGQYLQDNTKDGIDLGFPSRFAWPQIVADLMKTDCMNHAKTGASNREILYKILRTKYNKNDIAIIQWTMPHRHCQIKDNKVVQIGPWYTNFPEAVEQHRISELFYDYMDEEDNNLTQSMCIEHAGLYFDSMDIKNYHFHFSPKAVVIEPWSKVKMLNLNYERLAGKIHRDKTALDGFHPNEEVHNMIGKLIYGSL